MQNLIGMFSHLLSIYQIHSFTRGGQCFFALELKFFAFTRCGN